MIMVKAYPISAQTVHRKGREKYGLSMNKDVASRNVKNGHKLFRLPNGIYAWEN